MPAEHLCDEKRQQFVDCMFVHSACVQSGAHSFDDCLKLPCHANEPQNKETTASPPGVPPACIPLYLEYMRCWRQIFDMRTRFRGFK